MRGNAQQSQKAPIPLAATQDAEADVQDAREAIAKRASGESANAQPRLAKVLEPIDHKNVVSF